MQSNHKVVGILLAGNWNLGNECQYWQQLHRIHGCFKGGSGQRIYNLRIILNRSMIVRGGISQ
jgi:hypothetical protein